jgi:hypothetical protein
MEGKNGRDQARWFAVGRSGAADSAGAGAEAAEEALAGRDAQLLVVFCSQTHDLDSLLDGIRGVSGDAPLIGCSTAGEIATDGPGDAGVVVTAIGGKGFEVRTAAATDASERLREAGAEAAGCIGGLSGRPHRTLMMLTDGLAGDQQEIVRGAYSVVGAGVPLVGGCAGDDQEMTKTFQLHDDQVLSNSVVAAAISSDAPLGIGVRHGWSRVGDPMLVTRGAHNRVHELDGAPALDTYLDRLEAPRKVREDPAEFTRFASTHPLGLTSRRGENHVRFIAEADFDQRALVCIAAVPQGGLVWLMEGDADSVLEATDGACEDALEALEGNEPLGVMAFDCIARRGVLGEDGIQDEIARIAGDGGGMPVAGFYTYGEIARTQGVSGFHNQTLVVLAVS